MNGWVQNAAARRIVEAAGHDFDALVEAASKPGFEPVPLGVTVSTAFENDMRSFESQNVIAMLPGDERPDEYVLHTAHWDHLGRCTPDETGDDICNGAVDNATGTAALVALGEGPCEGRRDRSQPRLPRGDGGGVGPARRALLRGQPGLPAVADRRRDQHGRLPGRRPLARRHRGRPGQEASSTRS